MVLRSYCKCSRGNFNDFRIVVIKLIHIITYPTCTRKDIRILFTIREILFAGLIIARRAILTTSRIILRAYFYEFRSSPQIVSVQQDDISPPSIRSAACSISVVVCVQDASQPLRITIPVMISRQNRTVFEFDADA